MTVGEPGRWAGDRALTARCLAGEESAWGELVARHGGRIFSHCRLAGLNPQDAEDVAQEVLISALGSLASYRGCALATWLYRLTHRRIADYFRSPQRRLVSVDGPGEPSNGLAGRPAEERDPESSAAAAEEAARTRRALAGLPEPARSILTAYYLYEAPVREIAEEMEMSVNTVKSHLHRGRTALRRAVEERHDL